MCSKNNSASFLISEGFIETIPFPVPLFFHPQFVYRKGKDNIYSYQLQSSDHKAYAVIHFSKQGDQVWSLSASPFGSVYGNEFCTTEILDHFLTEVKHSLIQKGIHSIQVKHYPACYNADMHDKALNALLRNGFTIICTEYNQYLPIQHASKKEVFDHSKLHLIKKCREAGFTVSISSSFDAELWYDIIFRARRLRGHPMTIDLDSLRALNKENEEYYHFFEVKADHKIIACAVGLQVTRDVMYYYLAADEEEYRNYSPMTFLLDSMYSFALEKDVKILDMGISSSNGVLNEGLRWFKKSFGSLNQPKFILEWRASLETDKETRNGK